MTQVMVLATGSNTTRTIIQHTIATIMTITTTTTIGRFRSSSRMVTSSFLKCHRMSRYYGTACYSCYNCSNLSFSSTATIGGSTTSSSNTYGRPSIRLPSLQPPTPQYHGFSTTATMITTGHRNICHVGTKVDPIATTLFRSNMMITNFSFQQQQQRQKYIRLFSSSSTDDKIIKSESKSEYNDDDEVQPDGTRDVLEDLDFMGEHGEELEENMEDDIEEGQAYDPRVPTIKLFPVYTRYDMEDVIQNTNKNPLSMQYKDDAAISIKALFDIKDIQKQMQKSFGTYTDLQYYDEQQQWLPLQTQHDVDTLKTTLGSLPHRYNRIVPIKVPKYYEEFAREDDEEEEEENRNRQLGNNDDSNDEFDDLDHPSNIMNKKVDDRSSTNQSIHDTTTAQFMKHIPTTKPESRQEQTLVLLAQVVEQVIKRLHDPKCRYEKLHPYATTHTPQRLKFKSTSSSSQIQRTINNDNNDKQQEQSLTTAAATTTTTSTSSTDETVKSSSATTTTTKDANVNELDEVIYGDVPPEMTNAEEEEEEEEEMRETFYENDGHSIDTRVFIMELASASSITTHDNMDVILAENLRTVIMSYPNALDHIANCIHMFNFDPSSAAAASSNAAAADGESSSSSSSNSNTVASTTTTGS